MAIFISQGSVAEKWLKFGEHFIKVSVQLSLLYKSSSLFGGKAYIKRKTEIDEHIILFFMCNVPRVFISMTVCLLMFYS